MSYRTFKHLLGETSLERKCRFLFGACLLLLITGSFWLYGKRTENLVYEQSAAEGRLAVSVMIRDMHYEFFENRGNFQFIFAPFIEDIQVADYKYEFLSANSTNGVYAPKNEYDEEILNHFLNLKKRAPDTAPDEATADTPNAADEELSVLRRELPGEFQFFQPLYAKQSCIVAMDRRLGPPHRRWFRHP
ncbi:MAG: hypothetical protein R3C10_24195 [Pirellulales bacterium]